MESNLYRDIPVILAISGGIYVVFFAVGIGLSSLFSYSACGKLDPSKTSWYAAVWALYPLLAWIFIRTVGYFRTKFDEVFQYSWVSIGYMIALVSLMGVITLYSESLQNICVATPDEAQAFRERLAAIQRKKDEDAKVKAAQESTPAVTPVTAEPVGVTQ